MFKNNYFTEMCSGSEAGSYLRRIDFVYHSTLDLRVIKKKKYGERREDSSTCPFLVNEFQTSETKNQILFCRATAGERGGNKLDGFKDLRIENGSRQGQNLA